MMTEEPMYDEWIAYRQAAKPSHDLTDQVMAAVNERDMNCNRLVRLADRMNQSGPARWAACLAASFVGSLPFFYVAYVAEVLVF